MEIFLAFLYSFLLSLLLIVMQRLGLKYISVNFFQFSFALSSSRAPQPSRCPSIWNWIPSTFSHTGFATCRCLNLGLMCRSRQPTTDTSMNTPFWSATLLMCGESTQLVWPPSFHNFDRLFEFAAKGSIEKTNIETPAVGLGLRV